MTPLARSCPPPRSCHRPALALQACATDHFLQSCLQTSATGHASAEACDFTNPSKSQNFGQYRPKWSVLQAMGPRSVKPIARDKTHVTGLVTRIRSEETVPYYALAGPHAWPTRPWKGPAAATSKPKYVFIPRLLPALVHARKHKHVASNCSRARAYDGPVSLPCSTS